MAHTYKLLTKEDFRNGDKKILERLFGGASKGAVAGSGVTVVEGAGKTTFTFNNVSIPTVDAGAAGAQGSLKIYDFPEGLLSYVGGVSNLSILGVGAGIAATSTVIGSVGTAVAAADLTLTGTEADLVPSGSSTLVASAGTIKQVSATGNTAIFDGTGTAKAAYLNLVVDATGSTANASITVNGTVTLLWNHIADK